MRDDANTGTRKSGRQVMAVVALVAAALFVLVYRQVLGITQKPSWPPPPDAVASAGAEAATSRSPRAAGRGRTMPHGVVQPILLYVEADSETERPGLWRLGQR